jgi:hypothetical protein
VTVLDTGFYGGPIVETLFPFVHPLVESPEVDVPHFIIQTDTFFASAEKNRSVPVTAHPLFQKRRSIPCLFERKERDRIARSLLGEEGWMKWQAYTIAYLLSIQHSQDGETDRDQRKKKKTGN